MQGRSGWNNKDTTCMKKKRRPAKGLVKKVKTDKKDVIELGEREGDEDMVQIKWKDFEVHHLIAIRGEMDEEFAKTTNKQGVNSWIKLQIQMVVAIKAFSHS